MSISVSLIIPVYNVEKYLKKCLNSVVNQTYKNLEIILINDGSTDSSGDICNRYAKKYNNIKTVHQNNQGVSMARNAGINMAQGDWICFVDSDDFVLENYVEDLVENICTDEIDYAISGVIDICVNTKGSEYFNKNRISIGKKTFKSTRELLDYLTSNAIINGISRVPCCKLFRSSIIKKNNIRFNKDMKYGEDWDFCLSYMEYCRCIAITGKSLYNYIHRDKRISLVSASSTIKYPLEYKLQRKQKALMSRLGCSSKSISNASIIYFEDITSYCIMSCIASPFECMQLIKSVYNDDMFVEGMKRFSARSRYQMILHIVLMNIKANAFMTWLMLYCVFNAYRVYNLLKNPLKIPAKIIRKLGY